MSGPAMLKRWEDKVANAFSRAAPRYDKLAHAQREIGKQLWAALPPQARHVLDLGCGTGYWTHRLAQRYRQAHIAGADIAPGMLAHASMRYGNQIRWHQGDAAQLPLPSNTFDLVFSNLAIQWCQDSQAVMHELYRVLRPGGQAHVMTLLPGTLSEIAVVWQRPEALLASPSRHKLQAAIRVSGLTLVNQAAQIRSFYYPNLTAVMASIKGVGAQVARPNASITRHDLYSAQARYEQLREPQGLPVSYHCYLLRLEKPYPEKQLHLETSQ